ncbi:50S ribosomal protein L6 [Candidatus Kuenenbacteria bacterium RIFCSPLOWO2_12_FULL_42_13]|uniref:Large ribosomal subunit protein uL6 n=4 Tax=Candidatus Kueneniibacteriota TaxID=1752740 RepID=A0A1F6G0V3_9BACT|nr:MAG: 50S ribosomal protein L6 [Candidatus Kuenenbacteria bacterium RIFCSPHIGHO2_02_FULL_42_29]OGG89783.1 MAG: 50S ribosomal protein L6 [Candidatus Kuenenbacteria bacterium RIFCSPLOWO2_02_FULL_42_16]OGG91704.1 MAG: 50S ribosomal protein L6 [Candidatus Kuenenbacteria bacterium RIFCSPLOWO2_12_FULL_42_13]OGG95880.1 MAG: 50S ribosomal protein L6 [Candidatus Kuenenbacteria bacterium RBG_16_41_7]OGH01262.1 MAG: 50S ribosomal protein L6 [Candidatus Kuenenbacteria bacterium RIFCSPHIGHO2_12_FULL_42_14
MSRIGKKPINIPAGVTVSVKDNLLQVKGPKGELSYHLHPLVHLEQKDNLLQLTIDNKNNQNERALWGTMRQITANLVNGVVNGYQERLEIKGVGYKAEMRGGALILAVGFSHPVEFPLPAGVQVTVDKNIITLESTNKELLGETAANIRKIKKPEPYKGKGIKYIEEIIIRKAGKQVKTSA